MLLDTTHSVATPEGVELRLPVAGLAARAMAWLVDAVIKSVALIVGAIIAGFLGDLGMGLYLLGIFVLLWLYNVLFEVLADGATPGKKALGLRVMSANGTPVGWTNSLLRNLVRTVDFLPGCYAFGCVAVLLSRDFQRLGDMAAGTLVVYADREPPLSDFANVESRPVKVPLTLDEQHDIISFGERAPRLNPERAEELAALLQPVFSDVDAERLRQNAAWLLRGEGRT